MSLKQLQVHFNVMESNHTNICIQKQKKDQKLDAQIAEILEYSQDLEESREQTKDDIIGINDMLSTKLKIDTSNFVGANSVTRHDSIGSTKSDLEPSLIIPPTRLDKTLVALRKLTQERSKSVVPEKQWGQNRASQ